MSRGSIRQPAVTRRRLRADGQVLSVSLSAVAPEPLRQVCGMGRDSPDAAGGGGRRVIGELDIWPYQAHIPIYGRSTYQG